MNFSLKTKIVYISVASLFITIGAITILNSSFFVREYTKAMHSKTFAVAKTLKYQLDRLLDLKIALNDLVGFEEQCRNLVNKHKDIAYAMIIDPNGKILFRNDSFRHDQVITDPFTLTAIQSQKDVVQICPMEKGRYYDFIIPVFGLHGEHIAAVRVGFPLILISQKTKMMIGYSVGLSIIFLVVGVILMTIMLNRWISKPLFRLISVIQTIRQEGTESTNLVPEDSKDEVGQLAAEFNQMVLEIRNYNKKLEKYSQNLEEQVKARTQAYDELKSTQAQLIQTTKLASIGELTAGVAHELNQPLTVIRGNIQLMGRELRSNNLDIDELEEQIETIQRNTKRMMMIIDHLRTFSRQSPKEFSHVDVNKVIEDCFLMIGEQLRVHNIEVEKHLVPDLPKVKGNSNQLEQVFLNLITNARDAVEEKRQYESDRPGGEFQEGDRLEIVIRVSDEDKNAIEILFKDSGNGIPAEDEGKIFDPFFTTKDVDKGTGLGLSISYGIIKDHKGEIEVAETGPDGTTFRIRLPIADLKAGKI